MGGVDPVLEPVHVEEPLLQVHLFPPEGDQLAHSEPVAVGQQQERGVPIAVPADPCFVTSSVLKGGLPVMILKVGQVSKLGQYR